MPISVVFDPPLPSDSPSTFNTKAFTLLGDLNDWSTQANALPGEVATNLSALLASPPSIGSTTPAAVSATTLSASGDVTLGNAGTDLLNIGAGSVIKDASGFVGIGVDPSANGAALQILKTTNGWSSSNFGKTLLVRTNGNHPTIALPDVNDANNFAITNQTGVLNISAMPALSNNSTAPVNILSATYAGAVTIPGSLGVNSPITLTAANPYISFVGTTATQNWRLGDGLGAANGNLVLYDYTSGVKAIEVTKGTGAVTIPGSLSLTGGTFGYGVGAGGTVTQATSKSTAVTLDKPCGQITMNNAALAAGASVGFTMTNSKIGTASTVIVNIPTSSPNFTNYEVRAYIGNGNASIYLKNISGGSLSDAVVINVSVINGATS